MSSSKTSRRSVAATPRTVLVVLTDQHRAGLSAREGFPLDTTPTLDRLAATGRAFGRAYTAAPVCTPARISLLTGRYPSAHGVTENVAEPVPRASGDLFGLAREHGMRTALVGKNHSHLRPEHADHWVEFGHHGRRSSEPDPTARAFDAWLGEHPGTSTEATPFPADRQLPGRIVDEAIRWLATDDRPSLLWLSIPEPHVPYQLPEPYFSTWTPDAVPAPATTTIPVGSDVAWQHAARLAQRSGESDRSVLLRARANYVGMLRLIDDALGRLVTWLEDTGRDEETLVVALSDHGDFAGEYGLMRKGPGVPEALVRIPMLWSGAGVPTGNGASRSEHVSIVDVLPTLCDVMDWTVPAGVQGRSLLPLMRGDPVPAGEFTAAYVEQGVGGVRPSRLPPTDTGGTQGAPGGAGARPVDTLDEVTQGGSMRMVRSGRWKLSMDDRGRARLFDLADDPHELSDRSEDPTCREALTAMALLLAAWSVRTSDPLPLGPASYPRQTAAHGYRWDAVPGPRPGPIEEPT